MDVVSVSFTHILFLFCSLSVPCPDFQPVWHCDFNQFLFINTFFFVFFFLSASLKFFFFWWQFPLRFLTYLASRNEHCSKTVRPDYGMEGLMHAGLSALLLVRNDWVWGTIFRLSPLVGKSRMRTPWESLWMQVLPVMPLALWHTSFGKIKHQYL